MDDDGHVVVIEQPDGAMLDTPFRVARNGGAGRVRSHAEISKSASAPVRPGKFKKQRVAPPKKKKNVRLEWKRIRRYRTCYGARLDDEDIAFDMYQKAKYLMELSGQRMVPEQEEAPKGMHLWTLKRETTDAKGVTIREFECPLRFVCQCRVGLRIVEGVGYVQLERRGLHNINSHVDETNYDEPPELEEGTDDEHEDFDTENEEASGDEDDHPGDADESVSADVGL